MAHESLPDPVPQLCEECFYPVADVTAGGVVATRHWPDAPGSRVFLHADCMALARTSKTGR